MRRRPQVGGSQEDWAILESMEHRGQLLAACALALTALACGPGSNGPPEPDSCANPRSGDVDGFELGRAQPDEAFVAWETGDVAPRVIGPQGGAMITLRFQLRGAARDCAAQTTTVRDVAGRLLAQSDVPLQVYAQPDGSLLTENHFMVFGEPSPRPGTWVVVESVAAGSPDSVELWLDEVYSGPALVSFEPATLALAPGETGTLTLTLSEPVADPLYLPVQPGDYRVASVTGGGLIEIAPGETTATVEVSAGQSGTTDVVAVLGDVAVTCPVTVGP